MNDRRIAVAPDSDESICAAVESAGGMVTHWAPDVRALVWTGATPTGRSDPHGLADVVRDMPRLAWVQLGSAGVDGLWSAGIPLGRAVWTSMKGAFAPPVAEHALTLTLAGLRELPDRVRARSWGSSAGTSLFGADVLIVGGGGIGSELLRLLAPFDARATVVRRHASDGGTVRTVAPDRLRAVLPTALVVVVCAPLTDATRGMFGAAEFALMRPDAWLVNVARGPIVRTDELVDALRTGAIAGAALDVTDPEPLPDGHPLWDAPNCIITPHTADTAEMLRPLIAGRVADNVARYLAGEPLMGVLDPVEGY